MVARAFYDEWIVVFRGNPYGNTMNNEDGSMKIFLTKEEADQALNELTPYRNGLVIGLGPMGGE